MKSFCFVVGQRICGAPGDGHHRLRCLSSVGVPWWTLGTFTVTALLGVQYNWTIRKVWTRPFTQRCIKVVATWRAAGRWVRRGRSKNMFFDPNNFSRFPNYLQKPSKTKALLKKLSSDVLNSYLANFLVILEVVVQKCPHPPSPPRPLLHRAHLVVNDFLISTG